MASRQGKARIKPDPVLAAKMREYLEAQEAISLVVGKQP